MTAVTRNDILFRAGGTTLLRHGVPFLRYRRDGSEPEKYTHTRADAATCATYVDADGYLRLAVAAKPRLTYTDTALAGSWGSPGLLLESSRTNLCLYSQDFSNAAWTGTGTWTIVSGAATCGMLSLDLLGDDDAGVLEAPRQTVTFTGDGVKAISCFWKAGSSTSSVVFMRDSTAVADRLNAVITSSAGVPTVTMTTGTHLRTRRYAGGIYRFEFQTTSVTAANTNQVRVLPASTAATDAPPTGTAYFGGVQCENAPFCSSYIKTTSAAVTRAADLLTYPIGWGGANDLTLYASLIRPSWADASGSIVSDKYALSVGSSPRISLYGDSTARNWIANIYDGSTSRTASQSLPAGTTQALCAQFASISTAGTAKLGVGSGFGAASSATGAITSLGSLAAPGDALHSAGLCLDGVLIDLIVARGLFTEAEMAAAPTP